MGFAGAGLAPYIDKAFAGNPRDDLLQALGQFGILPNKKIIEGLRFFRP
jgi:hypothetical protein